MRGELGAGFEDVERADVGQREDVAGGARRPDHPAHLGMRHVAADEGHVLHARHPDVGNEHAVAEEMPGILLAQQARSDPASEGEGTAMFDCPRYATLRANLPCGRRWHKRRDMAMKMR